MKEKDTKITTLRNKFTPIYNYFTMLRKMDEMRRTGKIDTDLLALLVQERTNCLNVIEEVVEIIKQIPNDAIKDE